MKKLIGLCGLKGSGKSTVADMLCEQGYSRERMAGILKDMLRVLGLEYEQIDGNAKELPSKILCGKTPRWAMQSLGTEWGRDCIGKDIWINAMEAKLNLYWHNAPHHKFVIDDIRFPNEVELIHRLGGTLWRIDRPGLTAESHPSESQIMTLPTDQDIMNSGTIDDLRAAIKATL